MVNRLEIVALLALDLALLWVASSLLRDKGLIAFAAGAAALAWAGASLCRDRRPLLRLSLLLLLAATGVLAAESVLYVAPGIVQGRAANYAFSGYHFEKGGIFSTHPLLGVTMRPGLRRLMYWNGHWWRHETNADGYRGPRLAQAYAIFLGDSLIYGHGVQEDDTVPARFAAASGRPAANLGQQASCLVQAWLLLRDKGARLRPEIVFAASHPNDITDASHWYEPQELERFVAEDNYVPLARPELRARGSLVQLWLRHVALPLRTGRLLQMALQTPRDAALSTPLTPPGPFIPPPEAVDAPFAADADDVTRLGWRVHRAALARLKRECDRLRARLVIFDLGYPRAFSSAVEQAATAVGAEYDPAGRVVLQRALAGGPMYLHGDGHWTRAAADLIGAGLTRRH